MYLDLDVHYGDGVAAAFRGAGARGQVLTLSIHHGGVGFFPASEHSALPDISSTAFDPFSLSLPLHAGASCATFARVWRAIDRVLEAFAPDYIALQCGVDGLAEDPLGAWNWTLGGEGGLAWCVQRVLDCPAKVLLLGGGTVLVRLIHFLAPYMLCRWVQPFQHRPCVGSAHLSCGASALQRLSLLLTEAWTVWRTPLS
jgi:histone deacetylase 8